MTELVSAALSKELTKPEKAKELAEHIVEGRFDMAGVTAEQLALLAEAVDGAANTHDDLLLLGRTRQMCLRVAEVEESERWLLMAEQVWHLKNDRKSIEEVRELTKGKHIVVGTKEKPLWQWMSEAESWSEFCEDDLDIDKGRAMQLEQVWDVYHVQQNWSRQRMLTAGRTSLLIARPMMSRDRKEGKTDEDLEIVIDEGTTAEVRGHVSVRREMEQTGLLMLRKPLKYDGKVITFLTEDGQIKTFGKLMLYDPPKDISQADKILWNQKWATLLVLVGGEEE